MAISSIDDLLMGGGGNSQQPNTPEHQDDAELIEEMEHDEPTPDEPEEDHGSDSDPEEEQDGEPKEDSASIEYDEDEYGNKKERMSKGMKERLDRKEKQHQREVEQRDREINDLRTQLANQGASREVQQAAKDFEYDPDASGDWQQQLAAFVRHEVKAMASNEKAEQDRVADAEVQRDFEHKFSEGMRKFDDFREVISNLPCEISNPMTLATRSMENPAAFLYAAAKRHPQELERISKLRDPYGQMMEMGKLEERMHKNKPTTKAPRPLGRTVDDSTIKTKPKEKNHTGDDLLGNADAKRLATIKVRHRGNR